MNAGYCSAEYAASFDEIGRPVALPTCGGWALSREIPGTQLRDLMGCYPLFCCREWAEVRHDLHALQPAPVSFTAVTDPFGAFNADHLRRDFDTVRPYKSHFVADLRAPSAPMPRRHRRNLAHAQRGVSVWSVNHSATVRARWLELYAGLVARRGISGIAALSPRALERQLAVPGARVFAASASDGEIVGVHVWYVQGEVAYAHLGATDGRGHEMMASYALYAHAFEALRPEVRWLALGGAAGVYAPDGPDGLTLFKRGWATGTRQTYLCGHVLDSRAYDRLCSGPRADSEFFPGYRSGAPTPPQHADGAGGAE